MAEPVNTPMPAATPLHGTTPRGASPVHSHGAHATNGIAAGSASTSKKPVVLHIGDPVKYNLKTYNLFSAQCDIICPPAEDRQRDEFKRALTKRRWGDFDAVFRPFWGTGGEMGRWDDELISLLPDTVRIFASAGAGFDWADTKLLGERGIIYCNSGLAAAEAVADFALLLVISVFRHLPWCTSAVLQPSSFEDCHANATAASHTLRGQALGLVGFGNIGQAVAARARPGFGMDIHYYDVIRKDPATEARVGATFHASLEELLGAADCVLLCTPGGDKVVTAAALKHFKRGARFVNVARGSLVDEDALADALEDGTLSCVALDVHASEPVVSHRLAAFAGTKAMLTCHNAGGTVETHIGFEELSMRNIMAVLGGGDPITPVNLHYLRQ